MNEIRTDDYLSCGYVISRRTILSVDHFPELGGAAILSASHDLTELLPDTWCFKPEDSEGARAIISDLGLDDGKLEDLRAWFLERLDRDEIVWPTLFRHPATAGEVLRTFFAHTPKRKEMTVLGLGVTEETARAIVEELDAGATPDQQLYIPECEIMRSRQFLEQGGQARGFELLCFFPMGGFSCSWYCNYLHREGQSKLDISPGQFGLLQSVKDAQRMAEFCNLPETAAEPGLWLPVLLVEYPT